MEQLNQQELSGPLFWIELYGNFLKNLGMNETILDSPKIIDDLGYFITSTIHTQYIKSIINQAFHISVQVLYGGSVNENNIVELNQISNIDGFLVGGASKNSSKILKMYEVVVS